MGGFGVLAWLAIGAAAGWTISRLMVAGEDDALRGTAAGMVGGMFGGLGIRLLDSSPLGTNPVDAALAALGASLWLTWITCIVTSGRRRDLATRDAGRVALPAPALTDAATLEGERAVG